MLASPFIRTMETASHLKSTLGYDIGHEGSLLVNTTLALSLTKKLFKKDPWAKMIGNKTGDPVYSDLLSIKEDYLQNQYDTVILDPLQTEPTPIYPEADYHARYLAGYTDIARSHFADSDSPDVVICASHSQGWKSFCAMAGKKVKGSPKNTGTAVITYEDVDGVMQPTSIKTLI